MRSNQLNRLWLAPVLSLLLAAPGFAQAPTSESTTTVAAGQKQKVEGTVETRDSDSFMLRMANGSEMLVKMAGGIDIREKKSNPFRGSKKYSTTQVVRGLNVEVEGQSDASGALVANKIRFTDSDLKVAETVESRVVPVEGRLGANEENAKRLSGQIEELGAISNAARGGAKAAQEAADAAAAGVTAANGRIDTANQRIASLDDYEAVESVTIHFKSGSAVLLPKEQATLDSLATQAKNQKGFIIEVAGFASSDGNETFNRSLSERRALAVRQYLAEKQDIPLRRIITPFGYGESHPIAANTTRKGREDNRRAEVRILVSKGLTSSPEMSKPSGSEQ